MPSSTYPDVPGSESHRPDSSTKMEQLEKLRREHSALVEKLNRQEKLLNLLIHDIKNPLTAIQMTIDLLRIHHEQLPAGQREAMLDRVDLLTGQMRELLYEVIESQREGDFLGLARKQPSGGFNTLLQEVLAQILPVAEKKEIRIKIENGMNEEEGVTIDPLPLKLIIVNLLSNAIKYSTAGHDVMMVTQLIDQQLIIKISDHGVGLTRPDIEVIFKKFATVSSIPTAGEKQSGLGLYNVKTLVTALGGRIMVDSAGPNQGATFMVTIPLTPIAEDKKGEPQAPTIRKDFPFNS